MAGRSEAGPGVLKPRKDGPEIIGSVLDAALDGEKGASRRSAVVLPNAAGTVS